MLKPGGLISAREMIGSSSFSEPAFEALADAWVTFSKLLEANGSHPEMGKELPGRFLEAGFSVIHGSASFEYFGTPADVAFYHAFAIGWFCAPKVVQAAIKHGLATQEKFDHWRRLLGQWKDSPGAVSAIAWERRSAGSRRGCRVVGRAFKAGYVSQAYGAGLAMRLPRLRSRKLSVNTQVFVFALDSLLSLGIYEDCGQ